MPRTGRPEEGRTLATERALVDPATRLSENEVKFILALTGIEPPGPPRPKHEAYGIVFPSAKPSTRYASSSAMMQRIREKGGFSLYLDLYGVTLERIAEVIRDSMHAEKVERYYYTNGLGFDYHFTPDHARRMEASKLALFLHGVDPLAPLPSGGSDAKKSYAEIVMSRSTPEERRMELPPPPDDAEFQELFTDQNRGSSGENGQV